MINDYVKRLECCGIAAHTATRLVIDFEKEYPGEPIQTSKALFTPAAAPAILVQNANLTVSRIA